MKIAIYLGSFNPFHNGHLEVVTKYLNLENGFYVDKVVIVPTMQNPWKKDKVLDIDKRIEIIYETIKGMEETGIPKLKGKIIPNTFLYFYPNYRCIQYIEISDIERNLIPPYYSYATLHALKNKYCNDEVFVLCGEDTMEKIPDWMHGEQIIKDYNFLIVDRPKGSISSTQIRELVKQGKDISPYVNKKVIDLINEYYKPQS